MVATSVASTELLVQEKSSRPSSSELLLEGFLKALTYQTAGPGEVSQISLALVPFLVIIRRLKLPRTSSQMESKEAPDGDCRIPCSRGASFDAKKSTQTFQIGDLKKHG